jgi:hypothetical protein
MPITRLRGGLRRDLRQLRRVPSGAHELVAAIPDILRETPDYTIAQLGTAMTALSTLMAS